MNATRVKETDEILSCLQGYDQFQYLSFEVQEDCAKKIERSIYNASIDKSMERGIKNFWSDIGFIRVYDAIGSTLRINLDIESDVNNSKSDDIKFYAIRKVYMACIWPEISKKISRLVTSPEIVGRVEKYLNLWDLDRIGHYSSVVLNPIINKPYISQLQIRSMQETKIKSSKMYLCRCGERKTMVYEIQTRSLDEPATTYVKCLSCGHVWTSRM